MTQTREGAAGSKQIWWNMEVMEDIIPKTNPRAEWGVLYNLENLDFDKAIYPSTQTNLWLREQLQIAETLQSTCFTCVKIFGRKKHNTIDTFVIQWDVNTWLCSIHVQIHPNCVDSSEALYDSTRFARSRFSCKSTSGMTNRQQGKRFVSFSCPIVSTHPA